MDGPKAQHILRALYAAPWAIRTEAYAALLRAARGGPEVFADELKAAAGNPRPSRQTGSVAVVQVFGVLGPRADFISSLFGWASIEGLTNTLRALVSDAAIDAIVFEFDSPGGSVEGVTELAAEIRAARAVKPIYAIANTTCASAAYWLAAQAERVYVTKSGVVGSVGVFTAHEDWSKADEQAGLKVTYISAGKFKTEANPDEPLSDEAAAAIQAQVDEFYGMFVADVAKGRSVPIDAVRSSYGQGRSVLANDALAAGMVDGIDTIENVIRGAARAAATRSRSATAATGSIDVQADLGSGLPFADRLSLVSAGARGLAEHAEERAAMRAKEGRSPFSDAERDALNATADALRAVAALGDPEPVESPLPAIAGHRRARVALALAELGV